MGYDSVFKIGNGYVRVKEEDDGFRVYHWDGNLNFCQQALYPFKSLPDWNMPLEARNSFLENCGLDNSPVSEVGFSTLKNAEGFDINEVDTDNEICFTDSVGNSLFYIPDGKAITIETPEGAETLVCRKLKSGIQIGGIHYPHTSDFAKDTGRFNYRFYPEIEPNGLLCQWTVKLSKYLSAELYIAPCSEAGTGAWSVYYTHSDYISSESFYVCSSGTVLDARNVALNCDEAFPLVLR